MGPEAPAATSVAGVVREHLALARQCMARAQACQKHCFNSHHQALELSVGQEVLLSSVYLPLPTGWKLG